MRLLERQKASLSPIHGSSPILIFYPLPTFQNVQGPTRGKEDTITFHTSEAFLEYFQGNLYQSSIDKPFKYLVLITLPHNE
jgi:hypothetical protein